MSELEIAQGALVIAVILCAALIFWLIDLFFGGDQ
jgi:preprotein translocase subunit SecE